MQHVRNQTNLYIRSLRPDIDEVTLRQVFEKYGPITSICIKTNQKKLPQSEV
jgi:RNA recognition motif-containing protein